MTPEEFDALLTVARKHGVRGATITATSVEFVLEPASPLDKDKPTDAPEPEGKMPTRAEVETMRKRFEEAAK